VIFPRDQILREGEPPPSWLDLVDDSKVLTALQRARALEQIRAHARAIGMGVATSWEIDRLGISPATRCAMRRAVEALSLRPSYLLIDFVQLWECGIPFHARAHGDSFSYSIAAASIVAKVNRDRMMEEADSLYPGYEFSRHKGYGTARHMELLARRGPSPIHRRSFSPLRDTSQGEPAPDPWRAEG
jgi:ribonuclease HII